LKPRLYTTFLLWLLSELFENLPEVGDLEKPKLVFIFDEAHLLFDDAPPALHQRVEQVVRLIRSKGVGVYFCSQFPDDVPNEILGQLGNRFQHALRAFTPRDQKAVRTAAETFVPNPKLDVAKVISALGVGEALVSTLQENAVPMPVERTLIAPPRCRMGAITPEERSAVRAQSPLGGKYDSAVNRESAYEMLSQRRAAPAPAQAPPSKEPQGPFKDSREPKQPKPAPSAGQQINDMIFGTSRRQGMVETMAKQAARTVGSQVGREIMRGILGGIMGGSSRRR
jgi:DNA helicase HerA-like ATPase